MGKVVAITNQKGGVGKTTTSINLAASLAAAGRNVLLIDLDPQGNATMGSGADKNNLECSINEVLLEEAEVHEALITTEAGYDLLPSNRDLTLAEVNLLNSQMKQFRLRQIIEKIRGRYNFILIDCPPSINMLTLNGLVASDSVIIPMQCEYYALEGLSDLISNIQQLQKSANPKLRIEGILRTMYDSRNRLTEDVSKQLSAHFGDKVYQTVIPRNVRLAEAPSHGLPILLYDKKSPGANAYRLLAAELLQRHEQEFAVQADETVTG